MDKPRLFVVVDGTIREMIERVPVGFSTDGPDYYEYDREDYDSEQIEREASRGGRL